MIRYIGQITVVINADVAGDATKRLRELAQYLENAEPSVEFADHNGDVQDYAAIEAECEASLKN
jgi:hypothetical protein